MSVILICFGPTNLPIDVIDGEYLEAFDPEAFDGRGDAKFTRDIAKAKRFPDHAAAMRCWNSVPERRPLRQDGRPNKPLSCFAIQFATVED